MVQKHLSHDAVAEFLGGKPDQVPEALPRSRSDGAQHSATRQWLIHGRKDNIVPPEFSREYVVQKKKVGELAELLEIPHAGHFDLIDPAAEASQQVMSTVLTAAAMAASAAQELQLTGSQE